MVASNASTSTGLTVTKPSDREVVLTRTFDAPRALVFQAYTDPNHIPHWWGRKRLSTIVDRMDVRPGGAWRFVQRGPGGGEEHGFHGEYREVTPPERLVYTFEYEGTPGHVVEDTVTFEEHDGRTTVRVACLFRTPEDRDGMLQAGMEIGAAESWDRLAEHLGGML
jgi:uncharacterized protein YndB with AHSA1/START domain